MGDVTSPGQPPPPGPSPGEGAALSERDPRHPFATSPFSRLARTHALGIAGDAMFAIGLAGSVFFSLDFNSARWRVALYLVLTIAPFAVAAPIIGPAIDRIKGGRRWIIVGSMALRAVLCFFVVRHLDSLLFYPEAFLMLVLGKVYTISKSAVVPSTVRSDEELVEANSKLTVISAIAVVAAAAPAGLLLKLGGARWTLSLAAVAFAGATVFAFRLLPTSVAVEPPDEAERQELRSAGIFLAASAMGLVRGIVGFLSFMLAFDFKNSGSPLWELGFVAATAQLGFFVGAVVAPRLRRLGTEEQILIGTLGATLVAGLLTAFLGGLAGAALLTATVGATGSAAKQAFDAIVQRDAPDANRGRSFARFETRFQLVWVIGALIPIVIPIPAELGFLIIALVAAFAVGSYALGLWRIRHGHIPVRRQGFRRMLPGDGGQGDDDRGPTADVPPPGGFPPPPPPLPSPSPSSGPAPDPTAVAPPLPPPPDPTLVAADPAARGARRWARPPEEEWEPPPGFVSSRLDEPPTGEHPAVAAWPAVFDDAATIPSTPPVSPIASGPPLEPVVAEPPDPDPVPAPAPVDDEQLTLPLDPTAGAAANDDAPTLEYPEPPWRDAGADSDRTTVIPVEKD